MVEQNFTHKTKKLIDDLKAICSSYGLGNTGDEFRIITQVFLYKFLNDKFGYEIKQIDKKLAQSENWEQDVAQMSPNKYKLLLGKISADSAKLTPDHFISSLYNKQNSEQFAKLFSDTLLDIAKINTDVFSVKKESGKKIQLFTGFDIYLNNYDEAEKDNFTKAIINQLVEVSFEEIFEQKFDFFSTIFEHLIKDYNKDGGGVYAEYYTPHAIAKIMASILVDAPTKNVTIYDPSAGSGTLLMNVAHAVGEDKCTIYSQDQSDKSSHLLRLNLILNNLVHSIHNVIQGDTIKDPYFKTGDDLMKFDYIVSNPPFKLDFSNIRNDIDTKENSDRFFAGIPKVPAKDRKKMAIYLLFIQHIVASLSQKGKAAIVVPTGFLTASAGIEKKIREHLIGHNLLKGVVSMPSNIFATTGTNVSIIFLDKKSDAENIILMDASKMGTKIKLDGGNQKTVLNLKEEQQIIGVFNRKEVIDNLSVLVSREDMIDKNYSFSAGQYFEVLTNHVDISFSEFEKKMKSHEKILSECFSESREIEGNILKNLTKIKYD